MTVVTDLRGRRAPPPGKEGPLGWARRQELGGWLGEGDHRLAGEAARPRSTRLDRGSGCTQKDQVRLGTERHVMQVPSVPPRVTFRQGGARTKSWLLAVRPYNLALGV